MPTRIRRPAVAAVLAALAVLLAPAAPAVAHNALQAANPSEDARLAAPPTRITLTFLQKLDPAFTTIVLSDAGQRKVPTGEPVVAGATGTVTIGQPLANGSYTVAYRVVSADGHPVQGSYSFTVADPSPSTDANPGTDPSPSTDANPGTDPSASSAPDVPAPGTADAGADSLASAGAAASSRRSEGPGPVPLAAGGIAVVAVVAVVAGVVVLRRRHRTTS